MQRTGTPAPAKPAAPHAPAFSREGRHRPRFFPFVIVSRVLAGTAAPAVRRAEGPKPRHETAFCLCVFTSNGGKSVPETCSRPATLPLDTDVKRALHSWMSSMLDSEDPNGRQRKTLSERIRHFNGRLHGHGSSLDLVAQGARA